MAGNPVMDKQPLRLQQSNPTFAYRASNVKLISNGTEQEATSSPSLWRKFQRRISHDHSKVPVAYVKPSRRYSLELDALEDNEEEDEEVQNELDMTAHGGGNYSEETADNNDFFDAEVESNMYAIEEKTNRQEKTKMEIKVKERARRGENKVSRHAANDESAQDEAAEVIRKDESDEPYKDKKEEKKPRGRARRSKKTKQSYQRSMSAFGFFDMNDDEAVGGHTEDKKEEKKKEKGSKALSLKRQIVRKMSQSSVGSAIEVAQPEVAEISEVVDIEVIQVIEPKVRRGTSLDVPLEDKRVVKKRDYSRRRSLPNLDDENDQSEKKLVQPVRKRSGSESSALDTNKYYADSEGARSNKSLSNYPEKTRRKGTVTKSSSGLHSVTSTSLLPPPLTLTESRSLNELNKKESMDNDNMSPKRKVAGTWDFDDFQPDEEEKKKKKWSAKLGGFARRFGGGASVLQHAITHSDADGLQKLLQDANNRNEINNTKTMGVTIFHQACVFGDINIIQMLLSNGADVNLKTWSKLSPLKIAVTFGHFDAAKLLVEAGADQFDIINGYQMDISGSLE